MMKIIKNIKYCVGPAQYRRHKSSGSGFVLLFAVTLAAILLSIALGVSNIALKEVKFSTSAKDTNDAFLATDTGIEKALFKDKPNADGSANNNNYPLSVITPDFFTGLGSDSRGCANVIVDKTNSLITKITSKGYSINIGGESACTPGSNSVERELKTRYGILPVSRLVEWTNAVGVCLGGSSDPACDPSVFPFGSNSIKNVATTGWIDGASSVQNIPSFADGYIEFSTDSILGGKMGGLNENIQGTHLWSDIDFTIQLANNGNIFIRESPVDNNVSIGKYLAGDVFRVSRETIEPDVQKIKYYQNGSLIYTSPATVSSGSLFFDTSFNHLGGTIVNAKIAY
jgi:hypothetical protein